MTIPGLFKEYIWLIEAINRFGRITFGMREQITVIAKDEYDDGINFHQFLIHAS